DAIDFLILAAENADRRFAYRESGDRVVRMPRRCTARTPSRSCAVSPTRSPPALRTHWGAVCSTPPRHAGSCARRGPPLNLPSPLEASPRRYSSGGRLIVIPIAAITTVRVTTPVGISVIPVPVGPVLVVPVPVKRTVLNHGPLHRPAVIYPRRSLDHLGHGPARLRAGGGTGDRGIVISARRRRSKQPRTEHGCNPSGHKTRVRDEGMNGRGESTLRCAQDLAHLILDIVRPDRDDRAVDERRLRPEWIQA